MASEKLEKCQTEQVFAHVATYGSYINGFTYTPAPPSGHANVCLCVLMDTPESLAELWSVMRLGRPGTACVVRYQTA